ncbi:class I SAM-dependent DNA methyltransferase [Nakamurella sp. GG22]
MTDPWARTRTVYDTVAENYAEVVQVSRFEAPLDLAVLDDFARRTAARGRVLDAGCGPGRMTRYLGDLGVDAVGIDLAPGMIRVARQRHPDLQFSVGSIDALDVPNDSLAGVLAWYSVIHTSPMHLPGVMGEFIRVLEPGGWLLLAQQSGQGARQIAHAYGHDVDLTAYLYTADDIAEAIEAAGGVVHTRLTRGPEDIERHAQSFVLARKP